MLELVLASSPVAVFFSGLLTHYLFVALRTRIRRANQGPDPQKLVDHVEFFASLSTSQRDSLQDVMDDERRMVEERVRLEVRAERGVDIIRWCIFGTAVGLGVSVVVLWEAAGALIALGVVGASLLLLGAVTAFAVLTHPT